MMQKRLYQLTRDRLGHVIPFLQVDGCLTLARVLSEELGRQYSHVLFTECNLHQVNIELLHQCQSMGLELIHSDYITPELLLAHGCTGAILYNVTGHPELGKAVPSIYYSYGTYDDTPQCDIVMPCSRYAARNSRKGPYTAPLSDEWVLPPMLATRPLRRLKGVTHPFTVGVFTSGSNDKYPGGMVVELLGRLPAGTGLLVSTIPKYRHPGMVMALEARSQKYGSLGGCPVRLGASIQYMINADLIVYGSAPGHYEPYGRMVVEAMALGKPVICERKGVFGETLEHGVNAMLYDTTEELLELIEQLRSDTKTATMLGVNAQLWASWHDHTVHLGKLKRIFKMLGI